MVTFERPHPELGTEGDVILKRVLALIIDTVLFVVTLGILTSIVGVISQTLSSLLTGLGTVLFFAYFIYFEAEYGQTIGKMVLKIVVVTEDGAPLSYRESIIRTLLRIIDALPFFYLIGLVAILLTDRKQRLGDIVADTVVVEEKKGADKL